jgi:transcriptional regulator with XRE-family HTH domain
MNKKEILIELGNNIRAERNRQNMSQHQLAQKVGIQIHHVSTIENGQADIKFTTLIAILKALNLQFEKLFPTK